MKTGALWFLRKALYVAVGSALGAGAAYVSGHPELSSWTINGAIGAVGAAVVGDIRRAFLPSLFS